MLPIHHGCKKYGVTQCLERLGLNLESLGAAARQSARQTIAAMPRHYQQRIRENREKTRFPCGNLLDECRAVADRIDTIVRRETSLEIPREPATFRWATDAESRAFPMLGFYAPRPGFPRGAMVIPHNLPPDFCCRAALWAILCHECRPGHEYAASAQPRVVPCDLPVYQEGWAVYAVSQLRRHFPAEAELFARQIFLLEAAKCFLEIELAAGAIDRAGVLDYLVRTVGITPEYASRTHRRMLDIPGQGLCYFAGYLFFMRQFS